MLNQPKGCLPPHSNSLDLSEVPQVRLQGQSFPVCCLPSCLTNSPYVSTKVVREVASILRQQGIRIHCYLGN